MRPSNLPPPPVLPHPLLGKLCCSLCVQLIDALTDFAVFVVVGFACDACEERNAPPAAWVACLPPAPLGSYSSACPACSALLTSPAMARTDCATSCWPCFMALMFVRADASAYIARYFYIMHNILPSPAQLCPALPELPDSPDLPLFVGSSRC